MKKRALIKLFSVVEKGLKKDQNKDQNQTLMCFCDTHTTAIHHQSSDTSEISAYTSSTWSFLTRRLETKSQERFTHKQIFWLNN